MQRELSKVVLKPRNRLVVLDYLFWVLVVIALGAFGYYLYTYGNLLTLYVPFLLTGAGVTIILSLVSLVFATLFGLIGALGRLSPFLLIRWIATAYVEVVRGTPILVQLLLWYYGIGTLLGQIGFVPHDIAFQLMTPLQSNSLVPDAFNGWFYGVVGLSFNYGAYLTEVFRTGIESINKGQTEAALSLGLNSGQTLRHIVLPQAIRITIPPFTNYFITLVQDSALLSLLSVVELEQKTYALAFPQVDANVKLFVLILGGLVYLAICYPLTLLARYLESRMGVAY